MRNSNVGNQTDLLKDHMQILAPLEVWVRGIVAGLLSGVETNLAGELHGVALEVMHAVMEFEITSIAGARGKHLAHRRSGRWGHNPGPVFNNETKAQTKASRLVKGLLLKSHPVRAYERFRHR